MITYSKIGSVLLLHTNKEEGEEFLLHSYPETSIKQDYFKSMKGVFLACSGVSNTILGENTKIFAFKSISQRTRDEETGHIGNFKIQTKPKLDSKSYYKAAFAQLSNMEVLAVVILPM